MVAKRTFFSERAPKPVSAYSQAVIFDRLIFVSGQVPLDPATGRPVEGTLEQQVQRTLENLRLILEDAGSSLAHVLKVTVFLADINDYAAFNQVYARYFPSDPPARTALQAGALPLGLRLEIDAIAAMPGNAG